MIEEQPRHHQFLLAQMSTKYFVVSLITGTRDRGALRTMWLLRMQVPEMGRRTV